MTRVYGIVGWPLAHTLSPVMQTAAFRASGLDAAYAAFPVAPGTLATAIAGVRALGIAGLNVTAPHKTAVVTLLDRVDDAARAVGAVNTVARDGDAFVGTNTDADGLRAALAEAGAKVAGHETVVLGSGGAARAAVVALRAAGASRVTVVARSLEKARALAPNHTATYGDASVRDVLARCAVLVQASGATSGAAAAAFVASLPLDALPADAHVTDVVYTPRETALLAAARARGLATSDGLGMLLHQGALAFGLWTGLPAPLDAMRGALAAAAGA